jgi:hypothetical protein
MTYSMNQSSKKECSFHFSINCLIFHNSDISKDPILYFSAFNLLRASSTHHSPSETSSEIQIMLIIIDD